MNIIFLGPPGVGKGTQSRRLSECLGVPIVASGDMFREVRQTDSSLAREIRGYMDRGEYVPDGLTIKMVLNRLQQPDAMVGFILDGFPRTVPQAEALDEKLETDGRRIDHVILLEAPQNVILERLLGRWICSNCGRIYNRGSSSPQAPDTCAHCGAPLVRRTDEDPEVQRYRLEVFQRETAPMVEYYQSQGRLERVNAARPVDEVSAGIKQIVDGAVPA